MSFKRFVQVSKPAKRLTYIVFLATASLAGAQGYYVSRPDAGVLGHGSYTVGLHLAPNGTLLAGIGVGLFNRLQIGLSYGGENIIGSGAIYWNELPPGVQLKVSILSEENFPLSLAAGFDSQDPRGSIELLQSGFYLVAGRMLTAGWVGFDLGLGAGYDIIKEKAFHLYAASGVKIGESFSITPELTLYPQRDTGIINLGISVGWEIYEGSGVEFLLADILAGPAEGWTRSVRFQITQEF